MSHLTPGWKRHEVEGDPGDSGDDDDAFVLEIGIPAWERRLTADEKLRRSALPVLAIAAMVFVLLGGPGSIAAWLSATPPANAAALHVAGTEPWHILNGPLEALANPYVSISPANGPLGLAYACWIDRPAATPDYQPAPLHVAVFVPSAATWRDSDSPVAQAVRCTEVPDMTRQEQVLAVIWTTSPDDSTCQPPALYHSADRGATWTAVPWPAGMLGECAPELALIDGRIYASGDTALLPPDALPPGAAGRFITSADFGRTWRAADAGFADAASFLMLGLRPGGKILAQASTGFPADRSALWQSNDGGASWHLLDVLPPGNPRVFVSSDPNDTSHGGWGRLYMQAAAPTIAGGAENGAVATGYPGSIWTPLAAAGGPAAIRWRPLPLPPGAEETVGERPWGYSLGAASLGANDALLYIRPIQNTSPFIIIPQFDIWMWDAAGGEWVRDQHVVPANATIQGVAWSSGKLSIWLTLYGGGLTARVRVYTATL